MLLMRAVGDALGKYDIALGGRTAAYEYYGTSGTNPTSMARRPVAAWASRKAVVARTRSCRPAWRETFARTQREQRARTRARQSSGQTFEQSFPSRRTRQRAESSLGREVIADEIPMPRRSAYARAWILERFVLKVGCRQADAAAVLEQALTVGRHQVRHWTTLPHGPLQPQPAIHGEDHPGTAVHEFAIGTILSFGTSSSRGIHRHVDRQQDDGAKQILTVGDPSCGLLEPDPDWWRRRCGL